MIAAPAVAPESPKQATVDGVGQAPFVFAMTRGELPVVRKIQSSMAYLDLWYIENETVRTSVMLARGDQTPVVHHQLMFCARPRYEHTPIEAVEPLCLVGVKNTIGERLELITTMVRSRQGAEGPTWTYACRRVFTESRGY